MNTKTQTSFEKSNRSLITFAMSTFSASSIFFVVYEEKVFALTWKLPFSGTASVTQDWHKDSYGMWAIDLGIASGVGLVAGDKVLAPVDSKVVSRCKTGNNHYAAQLQATDGTKYSLIHFTSASLAIGQSFKQGDVIGTVAGDLPNDACAYSQAPHLHFGLPSQNFIIDGYTFNANSPAHLSTLNSTNGNTTGGNKVYSYVPIANGQKMWNEVPIFAALNMTPTPLSAGDKIISVVNGVVGSTLNVRNSPAGTSIGNVPWGAIGTYTGLSNTADLGGTNYNWLNINWDNGVSGFSAENYLNYMYNPKPLVPVSGGWNSGGGNIIPINNGNPDNTLPQKAVPVPSSLIGILSASIIGVFLKLKKKLH